jgi:uncharacterized protein YraI
MHIMKRFLLGVGVVTLSAGAAAAAPAIVASDLHLRSGPGTGYPVVDTMPGGARVDAAGCGAGWCRVSYNGEEGYASRAYLEIETAAVEPYYQDYGPSYSYYDYYEPGYEYGYGVPYAGFGFRFGHHHHHHHGHERGGDHRIGENHGPAWHHTGRATGAPGGRHHFASPGFHSPNGVASRGRPAGGHFGGTMGMGGGHHIGAAVHTPQGSRPMAVAGGHVGGHIGPPGAVGGPGRVGHH